MRRLLALLLMGAAHALLLWYGDILFMYAVIGFALLFFARSPARTLAIVGSICLVIAIVATAILTVFVIAAPEKSAAKTEPAPTHFDNPFQTWITALGAGKLQDPESPLWVNTETQAYREGPYEQLFMFRAATWLMILVFGVLGLSWHVAAMVFFGAALFRAGMFDPANRHWQRRLLWIAALFGLPLSAIAPFCRLWWPGAGRRHRRDSHLPRRAVSQSRLLERDHAAHRGRVLADRDARPDLGRAHGPHQLLDPIGHRHNDLLLLRPRPLRADHGYPAHRHRLGCVFAATAAELFLVACFPVRPDGMALAFPDLLAATAALAITGR